MKNKILALILTTAMLFSLAVINASAVESYGIMIAGITVDSINATGVTGTGIEGTITYDADKHILTLENATITSLVEEGIKITDALNNYTIVVKGDCKINVEAHRYGILAYAGLSIEGIDNASLTVSTNEFSTILAAKGATVKNLNCTFNITNGTTDWGCSAIVSPEGNVEVENSTITAIDLTKCIGNGLYSTQGNVTVKDSTLNIRANVSGIGIYAGGDVTITSTYLHELSGKNAIKAGGTVSIAESGGIVFATSSDADRLAINAASISITDNTTLKAGNDLIDAQTIDTSKSSSSGGANWSSYKYAQLSTKYGIKGDNPTWIKGSTDGATITSTASLSLFTTVKVDDHFVDESDYSAASGSTKISFSPAYLETLDIGDHEVTIVSKTGTATGTLTIKEATTEEEPTTIATTETKTEEKIADTADNSAIATFAALTAFSAAGFVSLKKKEN